MALNSMWAMAWISAACPSGVPGRRGRNCSGGTSSGRSGRPGTRIGSGSSGPGTTTSRPAPRAARSARTAAHLSSGSRTASACAAARWRDSFIGAIVVRRPAAGARPMGDTAGLTHHAATAMHPMPQDLLPIEDARAAILQRLRPVGAHERVQVRDALGRVLAEDVIAPCNVPAHDNSAMDGYAVRFAYLAADGETRLTVVGSAFAGRPFSGQISA